MLNGQYSAFKLWLVRKASEKLPSLTNSDFFGLSFLAKIQLITKYQKKIISQGHV